MRVLFAAMLLSTVFSTVPLHADDTPPATQDVPIGGAQGAALAANKALLSTDVHAARSQAYVDAAKKAHPLVPTPEQVEKLKRDMEALKATHPQLSFPTSSPTAAASAPTLGSSIGAMPAQDEVSKPNAPAVMNVQAITPKEPAFNIPNPNLKPLPASPELRPDKPGATNAPVSAELSDGTQAVFRPNGVVNIVTPDGKYHRPPDGVLTLKDGTSFTIEKGMRTE